MAINTAASRTPGRQPANTQQNAGPSQPGKAADWMKTGQDAMAAREQEKARQERIEEERKNRVYQPMRFFLKAGDQADLVVLDYQMGPFFHEHELTWDPKFKTQRNGRPVNIYEPCPKDWEPCPICAEAERESYYVLYLTIIDMRGYTNKDGVQVPFSKKLLPVKFRDQGFFLRQAERNGGSLRGVHLLMTRDNKEQSKIGQPEFIETVSEEDIIATFQHPERRNQQGEVVKEANADCYPYDYAKLFRKPSAADLRARYGLQANAPVGSNDDWQQNWGQGANNPGQAPAPAAGQPIGQAANQSQPASGAGAPIGNQSQGTGQPIGQQASGGGQTGNTQQQGETDTRQQGQDSAPAASGEQTQATGGIRTRSRSGQQQTPPADDLDDEIPY